MNITASLPIHGARHLWQALVGLPWLPAAQGPKAYDCWGLVRHAVKLRLGQDMPLVQVGASDNTLALMDAARGHGWRQVKSAMRADDIVLMQGALGRHCGFAVNAPSGGRDRLMVLHSNGRMTARGPIGCVMLQPLHHVASDGYGSFELWRCER